MKEVRRRLGKWQGARTRAMTVQTGDGLRVNPGMGEGCAERGARRATTTSMAMRGRHVAMTTRRDGWGVTGSLGGCPENANPDCDVVVATNSAMSIG